MPESDRARPHYDRAVPAKRKPRAPKSNAPASVLLRLSEKTVAELDAWLAEINTTREWPGMSRSELLRAIVQRAVRERWGQP